VKAGSPRVQDTGNTREAILDAAETIIRDEGYAAVTSRYVAEKAGLKSQLVYYYFKTMDDLFTAVVARGEDRFLERLSQALVTEQPLRALWEISNDLTSAQFSAELYALANHRKSVHSLISRSAKQVFKMQVAAIEKITSHLGDEEKQELPPAALAFLLMSISVSLANRTSLNVHDGHAEVRALVERYITRVEGPARPSAKRKR
jgi:AcrR family transcriptional regulator